MAGLEKAVTDMGDELGSQGCGSVDSHRAMSLLGISISAVV